jgi:MFS family permease
LAIDTVGNTEIGRSYPHYRRNFSAFWADYGLFGVAMAFINQNTVLPSFVRQLTASPFLIGLSGTIQTAGWLFPQLIAANYLAGKDQKKKYILMPAAIGRPVLFILALALFLGAARYPALALTTLFASLALLWTTDALTTVAWFDVLGKAIPAERRGRLFGLGQITSGLLTVGAGLVINYVLSDAGPPFPRNYAFLFLAAGAFFTLSWFAMAAIKEPSDSPKRNDAASQHPFLRQLTHIWKRDWNFRLFIAVRWLAGLSGLATPFYVIFAADRLGLGEEAVGWFTSAQVLGSIAGGVILGALNERHGRRRTIQAGLGAGIIAPLWALLLSFWTPVGHPWLVYGCSLVFAALGLLQCTFIQGFFSYLLDLAPADERPNYIALSNTLNGVVLWPMALVGGAILKVTGNSYPTLFAVTAAGMGVGLLCTAWLAELRSTSHADTPSTTNTGAD